MNGQDKELLESVKEEGFSAFADLTLTVLIKDDLSAEQFVEKYLPQIAKMISYIDIEGVKILGPGLNSKNYFRSEGE